MMQRDTGSRAIAQFISDQNRFLCCRGVLSESVVSCELLLTGEKTDAAVTALLMLATGDPLHA